MAQQDHGYTQDLDTQDISSHNISRLRTAEVVAHLADTRSTLVSRNITILGRRTSVRLEPEMWNALKDIARREQCSTHDICSLIQIRKNPRTSLTAAIRVFLMLYYRAASTEQGHARAGHGSFESMKKRANVTRPLHPGDASRSTTGLSDQPQEFYGGMSTF